MSCTGYIKRTYRGNKSIFQRIKCTCSLHQNLVRKRECQRKGHVGVKFPIFCYKFGGDSRDVGPSDSKGLQQHQQRVVPYITYIINFVTIMTI